MNEITILKRENKLLKEQLMEAVEIAKAFQKETGMLWGERIGEFLKSAEGKYFSSKEYLAERMPGEQ